MHIIQYRLHHSLCANAASSTVPADVLSFIMIFVFPASRPQRNKTFWYLSNNRETTACENQLLGPHGVLEKTASLGKRRITDFLPDSKSTSYVSGRAKKKTTASG